MKECVIYTDGACHPNPGPGGYGVILVADGQRRELSGGFRKTTNNRMELFSVISALRALPLKGCKVTIYSDAQYVVRMYSGGYAQRWRLDGWTRNKGKEPALNPDLWGDLLDLCGEHDVEFIWVRGHAEHPENTRCDEIAVAARQVANLPTDEGYEKPIPAAPPAQLHLF
ncbi:MAG: ribonuclease HI [bacterium]